VVLKVSDSQPRSERDAYVPFATFIAPVGVSE
jgi:hypothetical protein